MLCSYAGLEPGAMTQNLQNSDDFLYFYTCRSGKSGLKHQDVHLRYLYVKNRLNIS